MNYNWEQMMVTLKGPLGIAISKAFKEFGSNLFGIAPEKYFFITE